MRNRILYVLICFLITGCFNSYEGELLLIEPNSQKDFNYPYFLFVPNATVEGTPTHLVIEPNNSGFVDDDLQKHIEKAKRTATRDFYLGNYVARKLKTPLLVPVFPRNRSESHIYSHALDRDVIRLKDHPLERIDLQLLAMYHDARELLRERNIPVEEEFFLTGFSASGSFANRFAALHPDKVLAVAAGGVNGLLILPLDSLQEETLQFPIGVSDLRSLTGRKFQKEAYSKTPQFYFMGQLDDNDAIPFADGYDQQERDQIYRLLGEEMQPARWNACKEIYLKEIEQVEIKTYEATGHEQTQEIKDDVVVFFKNILKIKSGKEAKTESLVGKL